MKFLLLLLALVSVAELGLRWTPLWRLRRELAPVLIVLLAAIGTAITIIRPRTWTVLLLLASTYRVINLNRIIVARMQSDYLQRAFRQTSFNLVVLQILMVGLAYVGRSSQAYGYWLGITVLQLMVAAILWSSTQRHIRTTRTLHSRESYADRDLPTVSVAIPARNETADLEACLQTLLASDYPKLEVLVLDDRSQNKRTPEIIRAFAHDGVRFIVGTEPAANWLAKNFAYQRLSEEANGEYILFCGVDARFAPTALRELITTLLAKNKTMLSVLPHNEAPHDLQTLLVQPVRYAWELSLPRRLFNRPPVLSTCWLIKRSALEAAGTFKAASRAITPESYFARFAARTDGYSFLRSSMVSSNKPFSEQRATAIRTRYPQLHRRPELVLLLSAIELACLIWPISSLVVAALLHRPLILILNALAVLSLTTCYASVVRVMYRHFYVTSLVAAPLAALYDIMLLNYSMLSYEFGEVWWKGRNITRPVMRGTTDTDESDAYTTLGSE